MLYLSRKSSSRLACPSLYLERCVFENPLYFTSHYAANK
jgi:hypothetical protein